MLVTLAVALALVLDRLLGEPRSCHPLVAFGRYAEAVERCFYGGTGLSPSVRCWRGLLAVVAGIAPWVLVLFVTADGHYLIGSVVLYVALGRRSLIEHARPVATALIAGQLASARQRVARIVSRDTAALEAPALAAAAVESVLENGNDAIFGAIFWFVVAGVPGVVAFRLSNTLDAMWGYRNTRYRYFGWAAARLDDLMNFVPARLTALSYALCGSCSNALRCWRSQARHWKSGNAGAVMATGAGSLGLALGGPAVYHGETELRPALGFGRIATPADIGRALDLIDRGLIVWMLLIGMVEYASLPD